MRVVLAAQEPDKMSRLKAVQRSLSRRHNVFVLSPSITTRKLGVISSALLRYSAYALKEATVRADAIHVFNAPDFVHVTCLLRDTPICYDYRSNYSDKLRYAYPRVAGLARRLERLFAKKARFLLTVNDVLAERLRKITSRPVYVVPNYPNRDFKPSTPREKTREKLGSGSRAVALFTGNLTFTYDFELMFNAALGMPDIDFWVAGSGPLADRLRIKAPSNVRFLGSVSRREVPDLIQACDVVVAPLKEYSLQTIHNEQDVWKIAEAAALRKPVVATGVLPSRQYLSVKSDPDAFARGIRQALMGEAPVPEPRFWEDYSEPILLAAYEELELRG